MSKNKTKKSNVGKFFLGAALGATLGVLFAPKSGKETRSDLIKKTKELTDKAKEIDVKEVRDTINEKVVFLLEELKDLDKEKTLKIAKKKAEDLKKHATELVDYTKKKATPIVVEAAEGLKAKAIEATKKVLDKLESK